MRQKKCSKCKEVFPATKEYFYAQQKNNDGLRYDCKKCKRQLDKISREVNDYTNKYQKSPSFVYSQLKYQAKKRNMPFEISKEYYLKELAYKKCFFCGSDNTKHWVDRYNNDHNIGYTKENTIPSCELCNKMKSSLSPELFIKHCSKLYQFNCI